jgi:hypothetical protein
VTSSLSAPSGQGDRVGTIQVYTLDPCAPCEIVKEAVKLLEDDARKLRWNIQIVPAIGGDKKSLGKAYLAGVKHFPTVRLVRDRRVVKSFASVREGWTAQDVASFLRSEIEAETQAQAQAQTIELVANEARVAR